MPEYFPLYRHPEEKPPPKTIHFVNARVFDGVSDALSEPQEVLVEGQLITGIGKDLAGKASDAGNVVKVDCGGMTLMPGLIDMHAHISIQEGIFEGRDTFDQMAMGAMCGLDLIDYLQQGFTTCRDAGGNVLGFAKAVNAGRIPGPRIFGSGAFLSQTGGHGDTGCCFDLPGDFDKLEKAGWAYIVDGRDEILKAARNNLRNGATQLKIMAGGGVASSLDPIHMTQFTFDEMKAAVDVANDYGTYVLCHAYHDTSINRCLDAGVRCVEHGFLMSDATMKRIADEGCAISLQCVMSMEAFQEPEAITFFTRDQKMKAAMVASGAKKMFELVRKHKPLAVSGGDMFGRDYQHRQADNIIALVTMGGFSPVEAMKTATGNAGKVLSWSTGMNPYKEGPLGIIAEGAYADLILVDGDVTEDITCLKRDKIKVVVKDGRCYKYLLGDEALTVEKN